MMTQENNISRIDELIAGYFVQALSKEELAELQQWLKLTEANKNHFLEEQEVWFSAISANSSTRFNSSKAFQRFLASTIKLNEQSNNHSSKNLNKRILKLNFVKMVAAIALLVAFSGIGYIVGNLGYSSMRLADVKVEVPFGSKTKLYLPDGTLVWLNAGSTLSYSRGFGIENRRIELLGEGYFEVTKNKSLPFNVKTKEMNVQVLGTKFNFRNYSDEDEACVTLIEGKVQLNNNNSNDKGYTLVPNQQAVLNKQNKNIYINTVKAKYSHDWTEGYISFDEEKLVNIVRELGKNYNVNIEIVDTSLLNYRFFGKFSRTEQSIQDVLNALASTNKLRYEQNGRDIKFFRLK